MVQTCSNCIHYHSSICRKNWEIMNPYTILECANFEMGITSVEISSGVGA